MEREFIGYLFYFSVPVLKKSQIIFLKFFSLNENLNEIQNFIVKHAITARWLEIKKLMKVYNKSLAII